MFEDIAIGHKQRVPEWHFEVVHGHKALLDQLGVSTLSGFGCDGLGAAFGAAGALLRYAQSTQGRGLQHVKSLAVESESEFIGLDAATRSSKAVGADGVPPTASTVTTLLAAMRRAQTSVEALEKVTYGVSLAVDGAVAAVDADGDGEISLEEAVQAPKRIADWLGVWRDLVVKDKL